jgi:hypothetical protein
MFKSNTYSKSLGSLEFLATFTSALFSCVSSPADVKQMYAALSEFRLLVRDSGFYGTVLRTIWKILNPP